MFTKLKELSELKGVALVALFLWGVLLYLPYLLNIHYLPEVSGGFSVTFMLLILVTSLYFIAFPMIMAAPFLYAEQSETSITNRWRFFFVEVSSLVVFCFIQFFSALSKWAVALVGLLSLLISLVVLWRLARGCNRKISNTVIPFFVTLMLTFIPLLVLWNVVNDLLLLREIAPAWIACIYIVSGVALVGLYSWIFKPYGVLKNWQLLKVVVFGWFLICIFKISFQYIRQQPIEILGVLSFPAQNALQVFGRGQVNRDIVLDENFCKISGVLPLKQKKCQERNVYKDVRILLDLSSVYVEFKSGQRIEIDKSKFGYMAFKSGELKSVFTLWDSFRELLNPDFEQVIKSQGAVTKVTFDQILDKSNGGEQNESN